VSRCVTSHQSSDMLRCLTLLLVSTAALQLFTRNVHAGYTDFEKVSEEMEMLRQAVPIMRFQNSTDAPTPIRLVKNMGLRAAFKGRHKLKVGESVSLDSPSSTRRRSRTMIMIDRKEENFKEAYLKLECENYASDSFSMMARYKRTKKTFTQASPTIELTTDFWKLVLVFKNPEKKASQMTCTVTALNDDSDTDVEVVTLDPDTLEPAECACGVVPTTRIVGGETVTDRQVPWIVSVTTNTDDGYSYNCGGTFVSPRHIVTAAHCTQIPGKTITGVEVKYGQNDLTSGDIKTATVKKWHNYPNYNPDTIHNDIAVLELTEEVSFTDDIAPACLPKQGADYAGKTALVAGWGSTDNVGGTTNVLLSLSKEMGTEDYCKENGGDNYDHSMMNCFVYEQGKDSCGGDSGGPVTVTDDDKVYLIGAVSFGPTKCGESPTGVNARVSTYIGWIKTIIYNNDDKVCK